MSSKLSSVGFNSVGLSELQKFKIVEPSKLRNIRPWLAKVTYIGTLKPEQRSAQMTQTSNKKFKIVGK